MDKFKKIIVIVIFGIINICISTNNTLSEEKVSNNNGVKVDEMEEMFEVLKRERVELNKLKSELVDNLRQKEEVEKAHKEKELEKNGKVVLTNFTKESAESKEKLAEEQSHFLPRNKVVKNKEKIDQVVENADEGVEESEKVINNGDEIIHPFEIAGNLYKLGEYKAAVDIYQLILKNNTENDKRMWVTYQIANCYRKLGLYTDAIKVYREMREAYEGTYWAKQAQWYIQDIEWSSKVEGKLDTVIRR